MLFGGVAPVVCGRIDEKVQNVPPPTHTPVMTPSVILASGSPQRSEILQKLGVEFEVVVPGVEELAGGDPEAEVLENARIKANAVAAGGAGGGDGRGGGGSGRSPPREWA